MRQLWNLANQLTLFRLLLIPAILIAILYRAHGWALSLFFVAGITDLIDGLVARLLNQKTTLGAYLDPIADKLLLSSSFVVLALIGSIPWWVTILVLSRDTIMVATTLVVTLSTQIRDFPPTFLGKCNTTVQLVAVFGVLVRNAYPTSVTAVLAEILGWLTALSTVASGVHYTVLISRRLARHNPS